MKNTLYGFPNGTVVLCIGDEVAKVIPACGLHEFIELQNELLERKVFITYKLDITFSIY